MRLTSVAQMTLPTGRVRSLALRCGDLERRLPISFDQRRHVGSGDRPGSWMGLSAELPAGLDGVPAASSDELADAVAEAWLAVVRRHPTLTTVFGREDGALRLHETTIEGHAWVDHGHVEQAAAGRQLVRAIFDEACRPFERPSHRLVLIEPDDASARPVVVIGSDHAHVDMWSLLVVLRDLLAALTEGPGALPPRAADFADHTAALEALPPAPASVRHRWWRLLHACGDVMPRFPLPLGDMSAPVPERLVVRDVLDAEQAEALAAYARSHGARPATVAVSVMTQVTRDLAGAPLRAVFPVHSRHDAGWHDAVGWFITNAVLDSDDPDLTACGRALAEALVLGSWPLADVLAPFGDMPVAPGMFALSWLDLRRLPVKVDTLAARAQFVGAVIETDGVMAWFVLTDAGLHLRCRYPGTPEAEASVGRWLDGVIAELRAVAAQARDGASADALL